MPDDFAASAAMVRYLSWCWCSWKEDEEYEDDEEDEGEEDDEEDKHPGQ